MLIDGKRALAYVVTIDEIKPIEGYDRVEYARTNGWWCIISKNDNIQVGDKCVYFEVDSKVNAEDARFAFLDKRHYKIKTQKMCKVVSQGLLMPLKLFPELGDAEVNTDVTDILKVTYSVDDDNIRKNKPNPDAKYNAMAARHKNIFKQKWARWLMKRTWGRKLMFAIFGRKKDDPRGWPTHFQYIHKTDEERCENIPWVLKIEDPLVVTEKLDGTSCTYILERKGKNKFEFYVLSRNIRQQDENQKTYHDHNIYWDLAFKYDIENKLRGYLETHPRCTYVCIQGEGVGNVQGNPLKLEEDDLYVFNFINSERGRFDSIVGKAVIEEMGMRWVPILDTDYPNKDTGEKEVDYIDCVAWRHNGEFVSKYFTKGSMIVVSGRLQIRTWTDKDGNKRKTAEIVADNVYFGESKKKPETNTSYGVFTVPYVSAGGDYAMLEDDDPDAVLPF